jgi:nucleoside-diphosphate-sugar epimerase
MFSVIGITGQVGGVVVRTLIGQGKAVRAVVRDAAKGAAWAQQGCEIAVADVQDGQSLAQVFRDVEGVFVVLPPVFDPSPGFPESRAAWFMENAAWDAAPARETGVISSFLQPLDKPVPMVATADVGSAAA